MSILAVMKYLLLITIMGGTIAACGQTTYDPAATNDAPLVPSATSVDCRRIQHEMGETEICGQPQRIIVLGPYTLEFLLFLDVQPVGFGDHMTWHQGNYDNPRQQIPYLGSRITQPLINVGSAYTPSIEAILKAQPDLILGTDGNVHQYAALSAIAPTVLVKWADSDMSLRTIGLAIDRLEQAEQLLTETRQAIAATQESFTSLIATHPKVLLLSASKFQEMYLGNEAHGLCHALIEALGFQLVSLPEFDNAEPNSLIPLSLETLPQLNDADIVILLGSNFSDLNQLDTVEHFEAHQLSALKQDWEKNAIAQSLDASRAGRVYFIPTYLCLGLPGPIGTELYLNELQTQLLSVPHD